MWGYPNRAKGWWITDGWKKGVRNGYFSIESWSFSWSVSQSLKNYLDTSKRGLTAVQVKDYSQLEIGDVIFYDFQGDGRIDHSTIVTSMVNGEPFIHAHTVNSADRYFDYSNSYAYTPNTKYYFYHINDRISE